MASKAERAAAREKYCVDKLVPVLKDLVSEMLKVLPEDPEDYMRSWLDEKIMEDGGATDYQPGPMVFAAPPPLPAAETRPSVGTTLEIEGEILPEEEATRLSTLTQLIADTPGAARATWVSARGSVVPLSEKEAVERLSVKPATDIAKEAPEPRLSTMSQVIADTPGAARTTVVTARGTVVPEAETSRLSTWSQVIADTPGAAPRGTVVTVRATVTAEEAARLSTMSQVIADTPGAARATEFSRASGVVLRGTVVKDDGLPVPTVASAAPGENEAVTVVGHIVPEAQVVAEQNRLSTLTQLINDTPGAARGTLLTIRGSVAPTNLTPQEENRMSTLSQVIADTPGAARGTVVTVRGTLKSKPGEIVTAQVVVPTEEAKRLSTLSQVISDTPGAARATMVTVRGTVVTPDEASRLSTMSALIADTPGAARATMASIFSALGASSQAGEKLQPLDKDEEARVSQQKRASNAAATEQLRIIAEMEHAEHEAKQERASARKSALEAMDKEQEEQVAAHGTGVRKVPSVPNPEELAKRASQA
jgi:hypothetical protein